MELNLRGIPEELKKHRSWVNWTVEIRDGKPTKIPINSRTGGKAQSNNPSTWGTYEQAVKCWRECETERIQGIGFMLSNGFSGTDLDHCRIADTGEILSWARNIIEHLKSYSEVTPSDEGIRVLTKGKLPNGRRVKGGFPSSDGGKSGKLEMYDSGRFFTVTGHHLDGTPSEIHLCEKELNQVHTLYLGERQKSSYSAPNNGTTPLDDSELIEKAMQATNGAKFKKLCEGNWSDYSSQSEADLALCSILAFWTERDPVRIDSLFRQSGLMREKWDEKHFGDGRTYGQSTIEKAIEGTTETYSGAKKEDENDRIEAETQGKKETQIAQQVIFPSEVISGICGKFANLYSEYIEAPLEFLFFGFLTCMGSIFAGKLSLRSELKPETRYYVLFLGDSGDDRKSTAIKAPIDLMMEFLSDALHVSWGCGSAEGLQARINEIPGGRLLLLQDEFKALVSKCKIEGSVLLPCLNSLFENTVYESRTKTTDIKLAGAHLSIMGASTKQTYDNLWTSQFLDIGFVNRIFIIPATGQRKYPIPKEIPQGRKKEIASALRDCLSTVGDRLLMEVDPDALRYFEAWYMALERTIHTKRLDGYALRLMPLLALNDGKQKVDIETVRKTVSLMDWQKQVREELDPIDAVNEVAKLEEKIRRLLRKEPLSTRDLKRQTHASRVGIWLFDQALKNLSSGIEPEIGFNKTSRKWELL